MINRRQPTGFIEKLLDVEALILEEPRTPQQLIELTECKADTIHKYLDRGQDFGLLYIIRYAPPTMPGRRPQPVYAFQPKPFELPNAPVPVL